MQPRAAKESTCDTPEPADPATTAICGCRNSDIQPSTLSDIRGKTKGATTVAAPSVFQQEHYMSEVKFPYQGWVLTPGFKPVEKTFTGYVYGKDWHDADGKKAYHIKDIFVDKQTAIAWGRANLQAQEEAIDKKLVNIEKRRAALDKASA